MTKKALILEVQERDISYAEVHSDAGRHGHEIDCPNCRQTVTFAIGGWWSESCECGSWDLEIKAILTEKLK